MNYVAVLLRANGQSIIYIENLIRHVGSMYRSEEAYELRDCFAEPIDEQMDKT